jgi:hypothetical protein
MAARIKTVTGAGANGSAGISGNDTETFGHIEIHFDADPWQQQPTLQGSVTVEFDGSGPARVIPESGWATLEPVTLGQQTVINWTVNAPQRPGDVQKIYYDKG